MIVLNDNGMSIAPNVGALSRYFNRVRLNPKLLPRARGASRTALTRLPGRHRRADRAARARSSRSRSRPTGRRACFFEELDLAYVGVIDGHDVQALREAIGEALEADRPVVVHCKTVKGKGFAPAEDGGLEGMEKWHAAKPASIVDGAPAPSRGGRAQAPPQAAPPPQYTAVFGKALVARVPGATSASSASPPR